MSDDLNQEIKIGADATGVEAGVSKAKRSLKDLGDSAKRIGKEAADGVESVGDGGDKAAKKVAAATRSIRNDLQKVLAEQIAGAKGSREYYEALADAKGVSRNAIKPILDQIDQAKAKTKEAENAAVSWQASLTRIGPAMGAVFSGAALASFVGKVVSVQREFDILNSSLKTVTGSSAAAEREFAWLKTFAKDTPYGLAQATQGFIKMQALGLEPTRAKLTSFGNTASAMGKDLTQMIEAVADASTGEFERLKEFGIKAKVEGDKVSLTFQGVTKTIENSAKDITKYLEDIGNNQFGGAMAERAKTLDGVIAGLGDTWDELFRTISSNGAGTLIYDTVTSAAGAIEDATTILRAFNDVTDQGSEKSRAFGAVQEGLAKTFETVAVMAAQLSYVLSGVGREIGGWAAQLNALEIGPMELANPAAAAAKALTSLAKGRGEVVAQISRDMKADAEAARRDVDALTERILGARKVQEELGKYKTRNDGAANDPRRTDAPKPADTSEADRAKAEADLIAIRQKLYNIDKDYIPQLMKLNEQYKAGTLGLKEYQELVGRLAKANFKEDKSGDSATADQLAARLQSYKNNDQNILDARRAFNEQLSLLVRLGSKSELDALQETLDNENEVWEARRANFEAELAAAATKKNSQAEQQRIQGQMRDAERDHLQAVSKLRAESALLDQKSLDALEARISKEQGAARNSTEQLRLAKLEAQAVGLTGDALGKLRRSEVEYQADQLKRLATTADIIDKTGELGKAYRQQAADMLAAFDTKSATQSAAMVDEYSRSVNDAGKALEFELSVMGLTERERATAIEQRRIENDLIKRRKEIEAGTVNNPGERTRQLGELEAAGIKDKANAENKVFLQEWEKTVSKYDDIFRQGFADMVNSGSEGWKSFTKSLATTFKTSVADAIYQQFARPLVVNVVANLMGLLGGGTAQAVAGVASGGSALGTLGSAASGLSAIGGTFGMGLRAGLSGLFGEAGLAGTLSAGTTAISAGNIAGGLGTLAGPLALLGGGILVLNSLIKSTKGETRTGGQFGVAFDGSVTNARRDQTYTYQGQQFDRDFSNGQRNPLVNGQAYRLEGDPIAGQESTIRNAVSGTAKTINTLLEKYGSSVSLTAFSAGLETSGKGRGGVFAGGTLSNGATFGESGRGDNYQGTLYEQFSSTSPDGKAALEAFTLDLQQSALQALQKATDLPKYVSRVLADVDVESLGAEEVAALLQQVADLPNQLLQGVGLTRDALVQQFAQGLATGDAAAAGQSVADTLVAGIESSLYTTAAGRIFDIVNTGIIAPMIDAITTGATLSEVLSEASIDRVIENATRQAAALDALFKDERFVELIGRLRTGVGSALGAAGAAFNYAPQYQQLANSTEAAAGGASSLTDAVDELTKAYDSAIKSLTGDRDQLAVDMLRAQGRESDAKALERSQYLAQFAALDAGRLREISTLYDLNEATRKEVATLNERKSLQDELNSLTETNAQALKRQRDALSDSNKALFDQVQAIKLQQTLSAELPGVAGMYLNPQQGLTAGYDKVAQDLRAEGFADVTGKALERLSKGELAGLLTTIYNLGTTTDSTRLVLLRAAGALGTLKDQAVDMAAAETDRAFARAEAAANKTMEVYTESIAKVKEVFEAAKNGAASLFGEVDAVAKFQGQQGREFIAGALAQVRAGGALPDGEDLSDAISAVGKDFAATQFASQAEADFQRLVVANELKGLQDASGYQLTTQEAQLKALKDQVEWARQQVEALRGVDSKLKTLPEAIADLILAYNTEEVTRKGGRPATLLGSGGASFDTTTGTGRTSSGTYFNAAAIADAAAAVLAANPGAAGVGSILDALQGQGFSMAEYNEMFNLPPGTLEAEAKALGKPIYHTGTTYVPETGFALLQKGEAVIPTAYNPWANGAMGGSDAEVVAELRATRAELVEMSRQLDTLNYQAKRSADAANGQGEAPAMVELA